MSLAPAPSDQAYRPRLARRRLTGALFVAFCILATSVSIAVLAALLARVIIQGAPLISWDFLTRAPSRLDPESSGVYSALVGTLWVMVLTTLIAVPLGVGAAVYLHEYAKPSRIKRLVELNIANLAGVPSIVYGLLGLTVFVRLATEVSNQLGVGPAVNPFGRSVLSGALTLALLVLPVIIIAARESLAAVPDSIRHAAYALGATRWQAVRHHVLPAALPGILTGLILALSRAIGEAAPLIVVGAMAYMTAAPTGIGSNFTVLPIQIFTWAEEPQQDTFLPLSAAAIIVLLVVLFLMNGVSVALRAWQQRRLSN